MGDNMYPTLWPKIAGVPFFTVSAVGYAQTGVFNGGCNYGPDYGSAQQAVNDAHASPVVKTVFLLNGVSYIGLVIPSDVTVIQADDAGGIWVTGAGGLSVPRIVKKGTLTQQSAALQLLTYTPPKVYSRFRITCHLHITAYGSGAMSVQVTWLDEAGAGPVTENLTFYQGGTTTFSTAPNSANHWRALIFELDTDNSGTPITIAVATGIGNLTYNLTAELEQLTDLNGN
jgi:hypothetical protein